MAWAGMWFGALLLGDLEVTGLLSIVAPRHPVLFAGHEVSWVVPVLGLAIVAAVIPYVTGIGAARRLGAKVASFFGMGEILAAILFAWLLLGQLPSAMQILGGAFILTGVALVRADERAPGREEVQPEAPPGPAGRQPEPVGGPAAR